MTSAESAEDIAEDLLYRTGQAMKSGDAEAFLDNLSLPFLMDTTDGKSVLQTREHARRIFHNVKQYFEENEIVDQVRVVVSAEFLDENTVGSTHVARLLKNGGREFRNPFPAYSIIRRTPDGWRIVSCIYAILDGPEHNRALDGRVGPAAAV